MPRLLTMVRAINTLLGTLWTRMQHTFLFADPTHLKITAINPKKILPGTEVSVLRAFDSMALQTLYSPFIHAGFGRC